MTSLYRHYNSEQPHNSGKRYNTHPCRLYYVRMPKEQLTPDWAVMLDELMAQGVTVRDIKQALGVEVNNRIIWHYKNGSQPLHWRGEALITLYCTALARTREELPTMRLVRGHRVKENREQTGPRLQSLPVWPPIAPVSVAPIKRGRPKKVLEAA